MRSVRFVPFSSCCVKELNLRGDGGAIATVGATRVDEHSASPHPVAGHGRGVSSRVAKPASGIKPLLLLPGAIEKYKD